jgi:uncharacterized LabA/DUF88 family protein
VQPACYVIEMPWQIGVFSRPAMCHGPRINIARPCRHSTFALFQWEIIPMILYPDERIALFIDGANLYATAKSLGFDIDYKRLLGHFRKRARLVRAIYYTALMDDAEYSPIRPLIDWLDYNGYMVRTKPAKEFTDSLGRRKVKGSMDIELAVDAMRLADNLDHVVLFSGDGDFRSLVEALQQRGRRVSVVSTLVTRPPMVADELRRQADQFIDLSELRAEVGRDPAEREMRRQERGPAQRNTDDFDDYAEI